MSIKIIKTIAARPRRQRTRRNWRIRLVITAGDSSVVVSASGSPRGSAQTASTRGHLAVVGDAPAMAV